MLYKFIGTRKTLHIKMNIQDDYNTKNVYLSSTHIVRVLKLAHSSWLPSLRLLLGAHLYMNIYIET